MAHPTHRYVLKWAKMIAPKVRHLAFTREDENPLRFVAGQFVTLHIEGPTKILHRSYSIANVPNDENAVEIAIAYVEGGVASTLLFGLEPGHHILASGPYGLFTLKDERPNRYVLIGTGTGIAPYRSMLNEIQYRLENTHPELEIVLVFGIRKPEELLFADEFLAFAKQNPQFKFQIYFSRDESENLKPYERHGYVQAILPELKLEPEKDIVYLCGNPNMIDETFNLLTAAGFDRKSVRREKYLFSH